MNVNQKSAINATMWSLFERMSTQIVSFVIGIVLARLLSPHDFGIVGLTTVFVSISNVFIDSGFSNSLIRKIDRNEDDLTTAFYFNVLVGVATYGILWFTAPYISIYFEEPILDILVKIAGINILFRSLCIVQTAIFTSNLNIRLLTITNLCSQIPSGLLAILMAYNGMGVYALVLQTVTSSFLQTSLLWMCSKWIPKGNISKLSFKYLWGFGSKLLAANLIGAIFSHIYSVLIGKFIGKNELGFYSKASHLSDSISGISTGIVTRITLPILADYQNDKYKLCQKFREIMRLLVMVLAPLSSIISFTSNDIVVMLWTEKWLFSAEILKILIVGVIFLPISQVSSSLMQAVGRSGLILKLEFPKKIIYIIYIAIGFQYGVIGLTVTMIFINLTGALINMYATKKIVEYSYISQIIDIVKYFLIAYIVGFICGFLPKFSYKIFNITEISLSIILLYIIILIVIRDDTFLKYESLTHNKISHGFKKNNKESI